MCNIHTCVYAYWITDCSQFVKRVIPCTIMCHAMSHVDHTSIKNSPDIVELHENTDRVKMLWRVTGTCDITYTCHGIYTCLETHDCDSCLVTDDYNFFRIADEFQIKDFTFGLKSNQILCVEVMSVIRFYVHAQF